MGRRKATQKLTGNMFLIAERREMNVLSIRSSHDILYALAGMTYNDIPDF